MQQSQQQGISVGRGGPVLGFDLAGTTNKSCAPFFSRILREEPALSEAEVVGTMPPRHGVDPTQKGLRFRAALFISQSE
jgi:hypothetical protein